jgi:hypothetical protein
MAGAAPSRRVDDSQSRDPTNPSVCHRGVRRTVVGDRSAGISFGEVTAARLPSVS